MPRRKRITLYRRQRRQRRQETAADIPDDQWHEIQGILDERRKKGRTEYLVDWKPNTVTGQIYEPSWQHEVTQDALDEWEARKSGLDPSPPLPPSTLPEAESQESQHPRPANWRTLERFETLQQNRRKHLETEPGQGISHKRQKYDRAVSPPDGLAPSITSASSVLSRSASPLPSQEFYAINEGGNQVAVVLEKNPGFDPGDFHSVSGSNTQTTAFSSQSLSQLESQDAQIILTSASYHSWRTIPDSQDYLESSISQAVSIAPPSLSLLRGQRVIADSQVESEAVTGSINAGGGPDAAVLAPSVNTAAGPATEIPSGQGPSQSVEGSIESLRATIGPQSAEQGITYQSQPPFTPFSDSPTSASHLATATDSQLAASNCDVNQASHQASLQGSGKQELISSQVSQAAQVVHQEFGRSPYKHTLTQSPDNGSESRTAPGSSAVPLASKTQSRIVQTKSVTGSCRIANPHWTSTMEHPQESDNTGPHLPAEEDLNKLLDISAAGPPLEQPSAPGELDKILTFNPGAPTPELATPMENLPSDQAISGNEPASLGQADIMIQSQPRTVGIPLIVPRDNDVDIGNSVPLSGSPLPGATSATEFSDTLRVGHQVDVLLPGTVSPADVLRSTEGITTASIASLGETQFHSAVDFDSSRQAPPMGQAQSDVDEATPNESIVGRQGRDELITLPFQASARDEYMSRLIDSKVAIKEYSAHFEAEDAEEPAPNLVSKIDDLFRGLQNICDFPPDLVGTSLEQLNAEGKTKYARDSNGKFSFIYELLNGISVDTRVLIFARSTELLRLLFYVTEALEIGATCQALEIHESTFKESAAVVRLALPSEEVFTNNFDVIIGFDNSLASSASFSQMDPASANGPLILRLVTTHALDHIDYKVPRDIVPLERRQAILYAIVSGRHLVSDPERGQQEPHEIAKAFCEYLHGESDDPQWEPVALPELLLMPCVGSQGQPALPGAHSLEHDKGLKRKYDNDDDDEVKRLKTATELDLSMGNPDPPIPDEVLNMLDSISPGEEELAARPTTVSIHLIMLELLAQQFAELERQNKSADLEPESKAIMESQAKQLESYKRSFKNIYAKYRTALSDRQVFEKKTNEAEKKLQEAERRAEKNTEKLEQRIAALEADKTRLLGTSDGVETPLAANEKLLKEAQDKVKVLEKRLVNAKEESEYIRDQYRSAQSAAGEIGQLRAQLKKAEEEAGRNKVRIHEINVATSTRGYLSRISELETQVREREAELDRMREEARASKNGRRETRQTSVPRSPRMGVLSPRAPARSYPSSTSRGGSPGPVGMDVGNVAGGSVLPGMQLLPQTPVNGRWNQL